MLEVVGSSVEFDHLDGLTMLGVRRFGLTRSSRALKRAFDLVGAGSCSCSLVAPLMAAIALAIRLDSPARSSSARRASAATASSFEILKFRSMVADAEDAQGATCAHLNEARRPVQDRRATRGSRAWAASCARPRSTSCRSSSTSCAAR